MYIWEVQKKIQKKVFVFKTIAFESGAANSYNQEQDIYHWHSVC